MCCFLSIVLDCACSNRVLEIFEKIKNKKCDCLHVVLFQKLEVSFCQLCEQNETSIEKVYNILEYYIGGKSEVVLYYSEDPQVCTEKIYRTGR